MYLFGYGSLMWKHGFEPTSVHWGVVHGYARRFFQHSTDHRGTPEKPGRVVTLIPHENDVFGVVLGVPEDPELLAALDYREKDGYERCEVDVFCGDQSIRALTYVAPKTNPGFLGESPLEEMAAQIANRRGPSGANFDYLFKLADVLRKHGIDEPHVFHLEEAVQNVMSDSDYD